MKTTKTKRKFEPSEIKRLTKKQLNDEVRAFVALCFMMLSEQTFQQIAEKTTLSLATVKYLFNGRVSTRTHVGTVQKLGYAAGLKLEMTEHKSKVVLVDR